MMRRTAWIAALPILAAAARGQLSIVPGPPANFIDISQSGINLNLGPEDEITFDTKVGNAVLPAGPIRIANNGGIGWDPVNGPDLAALNAPIPSRGAFNGRQALLPFWDDIGNTVGDVFAQEFPDRLIVQWNGRHFGSGVDPNDPCMPLDTSTFQVQVFNGVPAPGTGDNLIYALFLYPDIMQERAGGGISATIGYQNGDAAFNDVQFSFNQANAVNNQTSLIFAYLPEPSTGLLLLLAGLAGGRMRRRAGPQHCRRRNPADRRPAS